MLVNDQLDDRPFLTSFSTGRRTLGVFRFHARTVSCLGPSNVVQVGGSILQGRSRLMLDYGVYVLSTHSRPFDIKKQHAPYTVRNKLLRFFKTKFCDRRNIIMGGLIKLREKYYCNIVIVVMMMRIGSGNGPASASSFVTAAASASTHSSPVNRVCEGQSTAE